MANEMRAFRRDYSDKSSALLGDIKTNIMDSMDTHFSESQTAYETAGLLKTLLSALANVPQTEGTKKALNKLLDDGLAKLDTDLAHLAEQTQSINEMKSRTIDLMSKLDEESKAAIAKWKKMNERKGKSVGIQARSFMATPQEDKFRTIQKFHQEVANKLNKKIRKIDQTRAKLWDEYESIEKLRRSIDPIKNEINSNAGEKLKCAGGLIEECKKYRELHSHDTD